MVRTKKQKTIVIKRSQRCVTRYKRRREDRRETIERKFQRNMRYIRKLSNFLRKRIPNNVRNIFL